jgi:hypothetical protein
LKDRQKLFEAESEPPEWAARMRPGRWYRISGDHPDLALPATRRGTRYLGDGDPARDPELNPARTPVERVRRLLGRQWRAPWSGTCGFSSITEAWNGAVYASRCGRSGSMVVFGGGHNDYFGSDVHAFDVAKREWRRLTTGYVRGAADDYGAGAVYPSAEYPDGSPLPPHTYDYVQYDALGNDLLLLKGQTELGPRVKAAPTPHLLNLDSLSWRRGARHPSAILNSGGFSTWDAKRRLLWGHAGDDGGGNAFVAFCPDGRNADGTTGSWREFHASKLSGEANHNAMQIHPTADRIVLALHRRDTLAVIDPNRPDAPIAPIRSRGVKPRLHEYASLQYAPRLDVLVYYSANDGAMVHAIEIDGDADWTSLTEAASFDPIDDAARRSQYPVNRSHTFGRFRIANFGDIDVALLIRHVDSPVYAMRLN